MYHPWEFITPPPRSPMLLDNLGLTISLKMLECWPEYAQARDEVFGKGKLRRWWMKRVFPRIRPKEYTRRVRLFEHLQHRMRQEFMHAVMQER